MKLSRETGFLILGIWLLLIGLLPLLNVSLSAGETVANLLAVAAGILLIWGK
ncbi:hypothetical protein [Thermaerobacter litoralis]